jgi:CheY-like chemotaxis protein/anti-sigma regulatory factor (Ser/Thr protein kinase)
MIQSWQAGPLDLTSGTTTMRDISGSAKILIVDDKEQNLIALEAILEPVPCEVVRAQSGAEALKRLLTEEYALILLDVQMPEIDGFETAAIVKQREKSRHIPIIFITANSTEQSYIFRGYSAGAVDYISKPLDPDILKSKVAVFVELFERGEEIKRQAELLRQNDLRDAERRQQDMRRDLEQHLLAEGLQRQWSILRDILASVTEGRLLLCSSVDELPGPLPVLHAAIPLEPRGAIRDLRACAESGAKDAGLPDNRWQDIVTASSEAAMNAVVHGVGGHSTISLDNEKGIVQIRITDRGTGIKFEDLPRATLERGYTTAGTLGHGFWIILETADRIFLTTDSTGTTIVLEQERTRPQPAWLSV